MEAVVPLHLYVFDLRITREKNGGKEVGRREERAVLGSSHQEVVEEQE